MFGGGYGDYSNYGRWAGRVDRSSVEEKKRKLPLEDQNVLERLEQATKGQNKAEVEECLKHITAFSSDNVQAALERYVHFYRELQWESTKGYRKNLHHAVYPFVKAWPNFQYILESFLKTRKYEKAYVCKILIKLFFHKNDREGCFMMINIMNQFKIPCELSIKEKYLPILAQCCGRKDVKENLLNLAELSVCFEMLNRRAEDGTRLSRLADAMSKYRGKPEYPQMMADLLQGALITNNSELLFECLEELSEHLDQWRDVDPKIFEKIYLIRPFEGIENWIASLTIKLFSNLPDKDDFSTARMIRNALLFLSHAPSVKSEDQFARVLAVAMQGMTMDTTRDAVNYMIQIAAALSKNNPKTYPYVLGLINHFNLHQDPEIRKNLMELLACQYHSSEEHTDAWLSFVQKYFPWINEENPVVAILREYLTNLPKDKHANVFKLLQFGIKLEQPPVINLCLMAIDHYKINHLIPEGLNCTTLLQEGAVAPVEYAGNVRVTVPSETESTTLWLPNAILKGRAPHFIKEFPAGTCATAMMKFLADPYLQKFPFVQKVEVIPLALIAGMYQMADAIGCQRFKYCAELYLLEKKDIRPDDIPLLLEVFKLAKGEFKEDLKNILLAQACSLFATDPDAAKSVTAHMRAVDPHIFRKLVIYQVLGRAVEINPKIFGEVSRKFHKNSCHGPTPKLHVLFVRILKALAPEIEEMELLSTSPQDGSLREIGIEFPALKEMEVQIQRSDSPLEEMAKLQIQSLKLHDPTLNQLQMFSGLPLRRLEFYDFHHSDERIEKWLKGKTPEYFGKLETLKFKIDAGQFEKLLSETGLSLMLPLLPKLTNLCLDSCRVTDEVLRLVQRHAPDLTSFAANVYVDEISYDQLNEFCQAFPGMQEISLMISALGKELGPEVSMSLANVLSHFKSLRSLTLPNFVDNESMAKLVEDHPYLGTLTLNGNKKLTDDCIPSLLKLNGLRELHLVNTKLTRDGILDLAAGLPHLKTVTFQLSEYWRVEDDERIIFYVLALKGIDVKIIERKKR